MNRNQRRIPEYLKDLIKDERPRVQKTEVLYEHKTRNPGKSVNNPQLLERLMQSTPCQIGIGSAGVRYLTSTYIQLRADHAIAKDAVYDEIPHDMSSKLDCLEIASLCENREDYLLNPNRGRRLNETSRQLLMGQAQKGADVQLIMADGLSAKALKLNGQTVLDALTKALLKKGLSLGKSLLGHFARVGLQDDIGVLLGCRATIIALGERPGLGTGDSLSLYLAINPRLEQDNSEKNCISNIRPGGITAGNAAELAANILEKGFRAGRGGLALEADFN